MGLDQAPPQKTNQQCSLACSDVEPTGEEGPRPYQEQLEENRGQRGQQGRLHLEVEWEVIPKQNEMAGGFHGPVLHREQNGISQDNSTGGFNS